MGSAERIQSALLGFESRRICLLSGDSSFHLATMLQLLTLHSNLLALVRLFLAQSYFWNRSDWYNITNGMLPHINVDFKMDLFSFTL